MLFMKLQINNSTLSFIESLENEAHGRLSVPGFTYFPKNPLGSTKVDSLYGLGSVFDAGFR